MGISRAETAKRDAEILRLLDKGTPPDVIARRTGAGVATVYRKRQVWLQARSDKAVADLYQIPDVPDVPDVLDVLESPVFAEVNALLHPERAVPGAASLAELKEIALEQAAVSKKLGKLIERWAGEGE